MMEYFVGLDASLRSCALCIVDTKGKVVLERELACEVDDNAACLSDFEFPIERTGLEAGTMSQPTTKRFAALSLDTSR